MDDQNSRGFDGHLIFYIRHRTIFCLVLLVVSLMRSTGSNISWQLFDFGPDHLVPEEEYQRIGMHPENPFWKAQPTEVYTHEKYNGIRKVSERTGVKGKHLAWTQPVVPGRHYLYLSFDAGYEDISTLSIQINGQTYDPGWQDFRPPPVPRETLMPHFRIWQALIDVPSTTLEVELSCQGDSVRLLNAELIPMADSPFDRKEWIEEQIKLVGRFDQRHLDLDIVKGELLRLPREARPYFWLRQLELLQRAEKIYRWRGWEWLKTHTGMSMIQRAQQGVMLLDPILVDTDHLLAERALWFRARFLFHLDLEYRHSAEREAAQRDFKALHKLYPDDHLLKMYRGERISSDDVILRFDSTAPAWSIGQTKAIQQLQYLVHYWVNVRQAANGELGGKLGDDVEALRFFLPLIYFGDQKAIEGWIKLADAVWYSDEVQNGFARRIDDVEHAAEFISDTGPPLLFITDDTSYHHRLLYTYDHFVNLWSGFTPAGHRHFFGSWYSATALDLRPPRNRDVPYNARALQPLRYWLRRHPQDTTVLIPMVEWARAWTAAAKSDDKDKPLGVIPASVRLSDEAINGDEPNWYEANMFWSYYDFSGGGFILDHLLSIFLHNNDTSLLYPMKTCLSLIKEHRNTLEASPGSPAWAAQQMLGSQRFWSVAGQWRLETGDSTFDDLLLDFGPAYVNYRISGKQNPLIAQLDDFSKIMSANREIMTSEAYYTDRILATHHQDGSSLKTDLITAMLTGDVVRQGTSPYMAVTWEGTFDGFTALVKEHSAEKLFIEFYNHNARPDEVVMRPWALLPGKYLMEVNGKITEQIIHHPGQRIRLTLHKGSTDLNIRRK